jgi:tRNA nucleotidyltransferase (CCA-adding enzyme)
MDPIQELDKIGNVYLIGGIVRDRLYNLYHGKNIKSKDYDIIVTNIHQDKIKTILSKYGKIQEIGKHFGIIKFYYPKLNIDFDIALPRKEESTGISYKDFNIQYHHDIPLIDDIYRRDATINSIALKVSSIDDLFRDDQIYLEENVVDYVNGIDDIKNKIWKGIEPCERFSEDPTRIMRAIRQCSKLDFDLDYKTNKAIYENKDLIKDILKISPERIMNELIRLLSCNNSSKWIDYIFETKLSKILELSYYDLSKCEEYDYIIKLPLLLNNIDISKWIKKYNVCSCPNFSIKYINFIIHSKLICSQIGNNNILVRRAISNIKSYDKCKNNFYDTYLFNMYHVINGYSEKVYNLYETNKYTTPTNINDVKVDGNVLMKKFNIHGKKIREMKTKLFNMIINLKIENEEQILYKYIETIYL